MSFFRSFALFPIAFCVARQPSVLSRESNQYIYIEITSKTSSLAIGNTHQLYVNALSLIHIECIERRTFCSESAEIVLEAAAARIDDVRRLRR